MRPDNETYALPYCPRPRRSEAAHSWLTRVAQEYGLNADRLLGHLLREHNGTFCLERAFYPPYVDALSKATRIPRRTLSMLQGAPLDWILQDRRYCNVCIRCIEMDALTGTKPFLRLEWRQAWRTNCSIHGIRLLRTTLNFMADGVHTVKGVRECQRLRSKSAALEGTLDRAFATKLKVIAVTRAVERMETVIDRAIGGHDPDNRIWGPLSASEFLIVVQDVTTWALSNFECFHARPEAENLPTGVRIVADFYFTMMPRHLPPFASAFSVRTLRKTPEPGLRAAALWMAEAVEPPARQWRLLKRRTPTGLYWLLQQMAAWPRRYTRHQWMDLNSILVLYR